MKSDLALAALVFTCWHRYIVRCELLVLRRAGIQSTELGVDLRVLIQRQRHRLVSVSTLCETLILSITCAVLSAASDNNEP
eukprot:5681257-Amphidinium_carterae.1